MGFSGVPFTRRLTKLRLRPFNKSGEYHYVMKVSGSEGMTAQWQHMQRQFHLPFPPLQYTAQHNPAVPAQTRLVSMGSSIHDEKRRSHPAWQLLVRRKVAQ
jgi:hypothetical protein